MQEGKYVFFVFSLRIELFHLVMELASWKDIRPDWSIGGWITLGMYRFFSQFFRDLCSQIYTHVCFFFFFARTEQPVNDFF